MPIILPPITRRQFVRHSLALGGTAMMTLLIGFGLLIGIWVHRDVTIGRRGGDEI